VSTEVSTKQDQWQKLFGYILGNQAAWIADIGLKAGLFRAIADAGEGGITEEALARRLDYKLRYVQVWCRGAYGMLAGAQLHEALVGCGMITQGQLRDLLTEAGFENVRVAEQPLPTRFVMLAEADEGTGASEHSGG
jgi:hypothetical protein